MSALVVLTVVFAGLVVADLIGGRLPDLPMPREGDEQ